ncbi:hypothetical protein [Halomarina oriensis]|uniref:Uncharacterized protein n=1 Tax=Halomarina oriensis TaxID=671145 RepID=A0A6B0GGR7_9EURY|nr:hypothetical protein [Halomarina oriensis]MWG33944.1 hypothetical protein [Halomarina oriensis]
MDAYRRLRRHTHELLTPDSGPASRWVDRAISALVVLNVLVLGASTNDATEGDGTYGRTADRASTPKQLPGDARLQPPHWM